MRRDPILIAALVVAAGLRVYGLDHGLPQVYNPDEANIMARALSIAKSPNPDYFLYPSFFFYFLFGAMGGLYVLGRALGRYASLSAFEARFFEDPTDFYLVGRLVGVAAALATVLLTYHLARKHFSRGAARAAAVFVAVAYFNVRDAHYLKHDVPAGFLVILALWAFDRALTRKDVTSYLLAGGTMGVGFATHYYMIFLAPAFLLAHWAARGFDGLRQVIATAVSSAVIFFVLSPFVILNPATALEHMGANRQVVVDRSLSAGASWFPSLGAYLSFLLEQGLGYLLTALVLLGMVLLARESRTKLALWLGFPLFFFPFITYTFFAGRYLNPVLSSLAVAGGVAVAAIGRRFGPMPAAAVTVLALMQPLYWDLRVDRLFASADTRTLAREFILRELASGERLAIQSYSVPLPQSPGSLREGLAANGGLEELSRRGKYAHLLRVAESAPASFDLYFFGKGDELNRVYFGYEEFATGLDRLREEKVSHVVLRYPPTQPPPEVEALFRHVAEEGRLVERFSHLRPEEGAETPPGSPLPPSLPQPPPYLDNEDWPPRAALRAKGPTIEIWSLEGR